MQNNRRRIVVVMIMIGMVLSLSGITYAYLRINRKQTNQNIFSSLECLDVSLTSEENDISVNNAYAISDEEGMKLTPYKFTIKNNCGTDVSLEINLENLSLSDETKRLNNSFLKVKLNSNDNNVNVTKLLSEYDDTTVTLNNAISSKNLTSNYYLAGNDSVSFELRLWIDEETTALQGLNKTYTGKIVINTKPLAESNKIHVTFNLNGGDTKQTFKSYYLKNDKIILNAPEKLNSIFNGWQITDGNATLENNILTINDTDVIISAKWKSIVTNSLMASFDGEYNDGTIYHSNDTTVWKDVSGNGNDATVVGALWGDNYLLLDGIDDYAAIGEMNYDNYTVEVVTVPANVANSGETVIIGNWETGGYGLNLIANGIFSSQAYISSSYYKTNYSISATANTIYHVAGSFNGENLNLYINGELVKTTSISGSIGSPSSSTIMMIGANPKGTAAKSGYYAGKIYLVRIYNRALSESEILQNYNIDKVKYSLQN